MLKGLTHMPKKKIILPSEEETVELAPASIPEGDDVDLDSYSERVDASTIDRLGKKKESARPDISGLPNAIGPDGIPVFVKGDKIVIERYASFLQGNPYLDTRTYKVEAVDLDTGKVDLWDENLQQYANDNWRHGLKIGQVYKLSLGRLVSSQKKRGRPKKNAEENKSVTKPFVAGTEKKGRGRPKGSKNRSGDVIKAEKAARRDAKLAKKAKKVVRKAGR